MRRCSYSWTKRGTWLPPMAPARTMAATMADLWKERASQPPKFDLISMMAHAEATSAASSSTGACGWGKAGSGWSPAPPPRRAVMLLSDLRDKQVRTLDGERLGRVHEVHCENGAVTELTCGAGSFLERLTARKHGRRIPWECVLKVEKDQIVVTTDPARRKTPGKKPSGSRVRQYTPQPSGRRSKR